MKLSTNSENFVSVAVCHFDNMYKYEHWKIFKTLKRKNVIQIKYFFYIYA